MEAVRSGVFLTKKIVPIEDWIESAYFLGPEANAILPFWKEQIIAFFKSGEQKFIFYGSYRIGKNYAAMIVMLRLIYEISCFQNFPTYFGLSPTTLLKI